MLTRLYIENFVLIEKLTLFFSSGLCALTGETGAGKSLIVDALDCILGARAQADKIRTGCSYAYLEASFTITPDVAQILRDNGFEELADDENLTLARTLQKNRSKVRLNGQLATQNIIRSLGEQLIDMLGQHESQTLLQGNKQREILDRLAGKQHLLLCDTVNRLWTKYQACQKEYTQLLSDTHQSQRKIDFLQFQIAEIEKANLQIGEEEKLQGEREILLHAEQLIHNLNAAYYNLYELDDASICDQLDTVYHWLEDAANHDRQLETTLEQLDGLRIQLKDIASMVRDRSEMIEVNPSRLQEVEDRLEELRKLRNKYGITIEEILSFQAQLQQELAGITTDQHRLQTLEQQLQSLEKEYRIHSEKLSQSRQATASGLEPIVEQELTDLGMPKTRFQVQIEPIEASINGIDNIIFLISPNPGEPMKPMSRIASGGESSRILLALKMALHNADPVPTLVFDEMDAGISGKTALAVSHKLGELSRSLQIICITHLPVIAAMAQQHLWIEKYTEGSRTCVGVCDLQDEQRIEKLAQLSGGKISPSSLKHAQEVYGNALEFRGESGGRS